MTNMLHRVLWGRGYAEPQQIPLAIAGEEAEVMAVSGGGGMLHRVSRGHGCLML